MDMSFYTAAVGAHQQQLRLDVHGNNIANVNTYGFRARVPAFSSLMTGEVRAIDEDLKRGVGARMEDAELDMRPSAVKETHRALDFAIEGHGFFAVQDPATGTITYTRDGSFVLSRFTTDAAGGQTQEGTEGSGVTQWYVSDGQGRFVLGSNGQRIVVNLDEESDLTKIDFPIGIFDFINYNGFNSGSENRLTPVDKNGQVRFGTGKLIQGYLETSNADLAYEFSKVIETQRSFQFMLRMVTASDEITSTVNNLR
ncbi:MAG: flagellar hook basal-body protein [Oscillospiraceae bacterium]|nr:flagellar hook basal-body protein [Oscillospiraceae bacterium]